MSRSDAQSRGLLRRPSRTIPATILAVVLLAIGVLAAVAAISRLSTGSWPSQVTRPASAVAALTWGSPWIIAATIVLAVLGVVLVVTGTKPGGLVGARLAAPSGASEELDYVISNRALARLAAGRAELVDGVDRVSASATGRRVRLSVTTTSERADEIRERVVTDVTSVLDAAGVDPSPNVSATVRTKGI